MLHVQQRTGMAPAYDGNPHHRRQYQGPGLGELGYVRRYISLLGNARRDDRPIPRTAYTQYCDRIRPRTEEGLYDPEDTEDLPVTDYQALYAKLRKKARPEDIEVLDAVLLSGKRQQDIADEMGICQSAVSHRFARAQYNLVELNKQPPAIGVRRCLYRTFRDDFDYGRNLAVAIWIFCETTHQSRTAYLMRRRKASRYEDNRTRVWWRACTQVRLRWRILRAIKVLRALGTQEGTVAADYVQWAVDHLYARYFFRVEAAVKARKRNIRKKNAILKASVG